VRGVKLRPGAIRALVDCSASRFTNRITPLEVVFGDVAQLERRVLEPDDIDAAFGALQDWLLSRRRESEREQVSFVVQLVERIASDPEITTVERLSAVAGFGSRALQRLFRDYVGASPKWVIRRNRLQEVALRLERGEQVTLAMLAAELHYADQAHLAHDFKSAVGKSPSAFARSMKS
jgi:AraC-like DNA-binding protein